MGVSRMASAMYALLATMLVAAAVVYMGEYQELERGYASPGTQSETAAVHLSALTQR